ncbi:hypothetical protein MAP00_008820 [Monascus purpureus]|nr:hypothetical protein MAP00_008820 [Monascus purpureus]
MIPIFPFYRLLFFLFFLFQLGLVCICILDLAVAFAHRPAAAMFQRIREAIDSRIAEEQARQKAGQESLLRSNSARRPAARRRNTGTPSRGTDSKNPDPTEFEPEFAIGDDDTASRASTPRPEKAGSSEGTTEVTAGEGNAPAESTTKGSAAPDADAGKQAQSDLPMEVRVKLRKFDKLQSKYQELLNAYRTAHARVLSIEPFEAALRENTPLTSIGDPKALTEYLNQISLKGDMVVEELKRVTAERDEYKTKFEEAQEALKNTSDEAAGTEKKAKQESTDKDGNLTVDTATANDRSVDASVKSPASSLTSRTGGLVGLFSKQNAAKSPPPQDGSEEFFSFDNEVPRLDSELKERQEEVEALKSQIETLKSDLSVARESAEGMVKSLESATRELAEVRDAKDKQDAEIQSLKTSKQADIDELKAKLSAAEATVEKTTSEFEDLQAQLKQKSDELKELSQSEQTGQVSELSSQLEEATKEKEVSGKRLGVLQGLVDNLRTQLKETETTVANLKTELDQKAQDMDKLRNIVDFVDQGLEGNEKWQSAKEKVSSGQSADFSNVLKSLASPETETEPKTATAPESNNTLPSAGSKKRKNNKKKKGNKANVDAAAAQEDNELPKAGPAPVSADVDELVRKIESLTSQLTEKEEAINRLSSKLKGEEDLKEEIESLRDDLLHIGQDHVEAKDKIKELLAEKSALEGTISKLEKELVDMQTSKASEAAESEKAHSDLKAEFENLKTKAATLETDLSAAHQLAASRFKDFTNLKETLQKLQPELRNLRAESSELKSTKEALTNKTTELKTLEGKHENLRADLNKVKSSVSERDAEIKTLNQKIRQETDSRLKAEDSLAVAQSDLRYSEGKKQEALESREKITVELSKAQESLKASRTKLYDMEEQVTKLNKDIEGLREEIQLKTAQHASAQSLMNSMRDQTAEMAMQMKEARERCESLEEELADAHRLLSERTREGETMRRLLSDIEGRTDAKIRDFKERMEAAIEERDRAEDEASAQGRRRAREIEELKVKVREAERALRTAQEDKEELEHSQKEWKRRRDDLEAQSEKSTRELDDVRQAMAQLRDALDESEKQVRELQKEKAELRRSVEETSSRLEKLRKSNKALTDDIRSTQGNHSSRSSIDSSRRGVVSPPPASRNMSSSESLLGGPSIDYIYLKNVLLQFLEQKDKRYQKQLIPVLGMLLHFDR